MRLLARNIRWRCFVLHQQMAKWLLHRNRHADVLEWVWLLNSYPDVVYRLMHGDKDTFRLAFALAGKSDLFNQVENFALASSA